MTTLFALIAAIQLAQSNQQCATPYVEATATYAAQPAVPATTRVERTTFVDLILVIGPTGNLKSVQLNKSSGNSALDAAAMDAARRSTFSPKVVNCNAVIGQYMFRVSFAPNNDKATQAPPPHNTLKGATFPSSDAVPRQPLGTKYARMCSPYQDMTDAQFAAAKATLEARNKAALQRLSNKVVAMTMPLTDARVLAAVRTHRPRARAVRILVKNFNMFGAVPVWSGPGEPNSDAVQIEHDDRSAELAVAVFSSEGQFLRLEPIASSDLERPYDVARTMAAYMLLNDLLADDTRVPRVGCLRAFSIELDMPGALPEIDAAMSRPPAPDHQAERNALKAYKDFASSKGRDNTLTGETIKRLGNTPNVSFIYRDQFRTAKGDQELDVVKVSNGAARTYVMLGVDPSGQGSIGPPALCLVGDQRCAQYYVWP